MVDMVMHQILPAAIAYSSQLASGVNSKQNIAGAAIQPKAETSLVARITERCDSLYENAEKLYDALKHIPESSTAAMDYYSDIVVPAMAEVRKDADFLEKLTASTFWPYPTYSDILFY